jgi:hypothetical protein
MCNERVCVVGVMTMRRVGGGVVVFYESCFRMHCDVRESISALSRILMNMRSGIYRVAVKLVGDNVSCYEGRYIVRYAT